MIKFPEPEEAAPGLRHRRPQAEPQLRQAESLWRADASPEQAAAWDAHQAELDAKASAHAATLVVGAAVVLAGAPAELIEMQGGAVGEVIAVREDGARVVQFPATVSPPLWPEHFVLATVQQQQEQENELWMKKEDEEEEQRRREQQDPQQRVQREQEQRRLAMQQQEQKAWRFGQYDRVHCNLEGDVGWASGNVQAVDQVTEEGSLPYVVMLDPPIKELISVPADADFCVLPSVCFAESPAGGPCAEKIASEATARRPKLRFAVGDRVACLCAGPDGTEWPRCWSAGTIGALWHRPAGAAEGAALPYLVTLDAVDRCGRWESPEPVLAHRDDHMYVRALDLQPAGECANGTGLQRFTTRANATCADCRERVDHQTLVVRKVSAPASDSDDSSSDSDSD